VDALGWVTACLFQLARADEATMTIGLSAPPPDIYDAHRFRRYLHKRFLADHYANHPSLESESYEKQRRSLIEAASEHLISIPSILAISAARRVDLIANCTPLQAAWLSETVLVLRTRFSDPASVLSGAVIGRALGRAAGISKRRPQAGSLVEAGHPLLPRPFLFSKSALDVIRPHVGLIVGQIAYLLPPKNFIEGYDLILTSFPHFRSRIRAAGVASEYFRLASIACDARL